MTVSAKILLYIDVAGAFMRQPYRAERSRILAVGVSLLVLLAASDPASAQSAATTTPAGDGVDAPVQLPVVEVTDQGEASPEGSAESGYRATTQSATPLGTLPLKDTPYSINVTPGELIENTGAHNLIDAVRTNPTASMLMSSAAGGAGSMTRLMVRGFAADDQNDFRDGLADRSFSYPPIENVDRIEILNGFSSFFQGFGSPGGNVNYVSKGPTATPLASVTVGDYGGGIAYVHGDLGGSVPGTDGRLGYRFNAYREDGETTVDGGRQKRALLSAVTTYHVTPGTSLTADIWHQDYLATGLQTYFANTATGTWDGSISKVPSASAFKASKQFGQDWTFNKADKTLAGLRFESELNDTVTLRAGYRHGDMWRQYDYVNALSLASDGSYTEKYMASPRQLERTDSSYDLLDVHFGTWDIRHTLTGGYAGTHFFYQRGNDVTEVLGTSDIASPVTYADPQMALGTGTGWYNTWYNNFLIGDRIELNDQWSALLGSNHAELRNKQWNTTSITSKYHQADDTPTYALTYKPVSNIATYVSYMESLVTGGVAGSTAANANQQLSPSVSTQYETGVKTSFGDMDINAALFRIDKINEETDPSDNVYKQDGREIHQGVEVMATGKLTSRLAVVSGFTLMDAHVEKATAAPLSDGKIPVNVPEQQASAYLEYALPWVRDLTVTGGANYYGRRPADTYNRAFLPDATIFNAGLRYEPDLYGHKTAITLTVSNLFDTAYWANYSSGNGLLLGAPRVVSLSLKASW